MEQLPALDATNLLGCFLQICSHNQTLWSCCHVQLARLIRQHMVSHMFPCLMTCCVEPAIFCPQEFIAKLIKEGGKKGVEIEGASDMGGLDFFCTTMELPDGDTDLLLMSMDAMNSDPDPEAEDRKGCSGHVGKMIYSAGVKQLALVAYVPDAEHNKSASKIDVQVWMDHVLKTVGGGKVLTAKKAATSPKGGHIVVACIPADPDKGKFPLKDKDSSMAAAFDFLRKHDAFPEDKDSSDEMVFGDDDNLEDYE